LDAKKTDNLEAVRYEFVSTQSGLTSEPPDNKWLRVGINSQALYDHASNIVLASGGSVWLSMGQSLSNTLWWAKDMGHFRQCGENLTADEVF